MSVDMFLNLLHITHAATANFYGATIKYLV